MEIAKRQFSRKEALKLSLLGSAALLLPLERVARTQVNIENRIPIEQVPTLLPPFQAPLAVPPVLRRVGSDRVSGADPATGRSFSGTDYYQIVQQSKDVQILPADKGFGLTEIWGYNGITPGPTIKVNRDRRTVVRQINQLPATHPDLGYESWTSTHLHGSATKPQYDGYASDVTDPGQFKDYRYPNFQEARTMWYHDHGVHHTGENAYMGLAAQYHVHDALEQGLRIPQGKYDVPLVIQDKIFAQNGRFIFDNDGESNLYGDVILVNGVPWPFMQVERRKYRFRFLNGSVSRSFEPALSTGDDNLTVIGHDGGLAPAPVRVNSFRIGMAERYEVVIDFSRYRVGDQIVLQNREPENNVNFPQTNVIMRFDVVGEATDTSNNQVPSELNPENEVMLLQESDVTVEPGSPGSPQNPRVMEIVRQGGMWTINGRTWEDVEASDFKEVFANPAKDAVEIWELKNNSDGWFHPLHIHLIDFKILSRNGGAPFPHERGPKDVAYIGGGETVRILARFGPHQGRYMVHCHNLVHEDHDMMTQFKVGDVDDDNDSDDPRKADPARPIAEAPPLVPPQPRAPRQRRRRKRKRRNKKNKR